MADMTPDEARAAVDHIKSELKAVLDGLADRVAAIHQGRAWLALGYADWDDMCDVEFSGLRIPPPAIGKIVRELKGKGLSARAIAPVVGLSKSTVSAMPGVQNRTPGPVVGLDGKTYAQKPRTKQAQAAPTAKQALRFLDTSGINQSAVTGPRPAVDTDEEWLRTHIVTAAQRCLKAIVTAQGMTPSQLAAAPGIPDAMLALKQAHDDLAAYIANPVAVDIDGQAAS